MTATDPERSEGSPEAFRFVEFPVTRVMAILRDSPAWDLIRRSVPIEAGRLLPCTLEEFESLREDCMILDLPTKALPEDV